METCLMAYRKTLAFLKSDDVESLWGRFGTRSITVIHCQECGKLVWVRGGSTKSSLCGSLHGHELTTNDTEQCCTCKYQDEDEVFVTGGPSTTFGYGAEIWVHSAAGIKDTVLLYLDIDGVLTPCRKTFQCMDHRKETVYGNADGSSFVAQHEDARWSKDFSDRDSWVLMRMKKDIVFISHDKRNEHYVDYKDHKFCRASHNDGDKFEVLKKDLKERLRHSDADGDPDAINYIYIGDAPFDYECLKHARYGFIPQDASSLLVKKIFATDCQKHVRQLRSRGGEGCIEEAVIWLYYNAREELDWDVLKDIEKYLGA